jgi:hypothetical protein
MTSTAVLATALIWVVSARQSSGSPLTVQQELPFELPGRGEPWPKVVLDSSEFDFGTMDVQQEHEHAFVVRNEGTAPLKLKVGDSTCKCTIGRLLREEIAPGESAKIHLQWKTIGAAETFRQSAEILTNDPDRPRFGLVITGKVRTFLNMSPRELIFSDASAHEEASRSTTVFSQAVDQFQVTKVAATSNYIATEVRPASPASLENGRALSGHEVAVTIKRGFPLGRFSERVTIETDIPNVEPLQLLVKGMISGDVSIYGSQWNSEMGYLRIGSVGRNEGATGEVHLYAHGPYRELQPEDFKIDKHPEFLKVRLTRDAELTGAKAPAHYIVAIEVPPNAPPANHLGSKDAPLGEVRLTPKHSETSGAVPVKLGVQFNVQQ